jgi:hypothetical protein
MIGKIFKALPTQAVIGKIFKALPTQTDTIVLIYKISGCP